MRTTKMTKLRNKYKTSIDLFDLDVLISHVTKKPREFFIAHPEYKFSFWEYLKLKLAVHQRKHGVPVAYITGHKEFYGLDFLVNKHVLIPRPDTEIIVENVLKNNTDKKFTLIDIGTGSGCIPIAIGRVSRIGRIGKILATDISRGALRVAKKNAKRHQVDITFFHGDLLLPIFKKNIIQPSDTIILTANLPYLTEQQFDEEPSIQHEPKTALVADEDGLGLYRKLLTHIAQLPKVSLAAYFEIDPTQTETIKQLIVTQFPIANMTALKDLAGNDRCIKFILL